jgi:hypothetical protein
MTTTHDDNATTWRELADQLTPEQIRRFDRQESAAMRMFQQKPQPRGWVPESAEDITRGFLNEARWEAQQNLNDKMINVAVPAGVVEVEHWEDGGTGHWTRLVHAECRSVPGFDAAVYVNGVQTTDGAVTWSLYLHCEDRDDLTGDQVRQLAGHLLDAADELDRLNS